MARINDVGGVEGFALPEPEPDELPFHADWEAHVFAMNRALLAPPGPITSTSFVTRSSGCRRLSI
jgi:hypothetical protein